jgi:hypothetical protein
MVIRPVRLGIRHYGYWNVYNMRMYQRASTYLLVPYLHIQYQTVTVHLFVSNIKMELY